jgi:hypothetical protein
MCQDTDFSEFLPQLLQLNQTMLVLASALSRPPGEAYAQGLGGVQFNQKFGGEFQPHPPPLASEACTLKSSPFSGFI